MKPAGPFFPTRSDLPGGIIKSGLILAIAILIFSIIESPGGLASNCSYRCIAGSVTQVATAPGKENPEDFIKRYYELIDHDKFDEAYKLNSRYFSSKVTIGDFKKEWDNNKSITLEKVEIITRSDVEALVLVRFISEDIDLKTGSDITTPYRAPIRLVFENGSWRYDGGIFRTDTPRRQLEFSGIKGLSPSPVRPFTSMDMEISFKNNGKSGVRGGITVSFPDSPMVTISPSQKGMKLYAPGDIISTCTRGKIRATDLVLEYWAESPWKSGETRTIKFQLTPRSEGRCRIRYRAMVRDDEDADYPCPLNSEIQDQQGFACFENVVHVSYIGVEPTETPAGISPEWRYPPSILSVIEDMRRNPSAPLLDYRHMRLNSPGGRIFFIDVNPRGDRLAAEIEEEDGKHRLFIQNLISGEWTRWDYDQALEVFRPLWSPDGKSLAFYINQGSGDELWTLAWEDRRSKPEKVPGTGVNADSMPDRYPAWSPDGGKLVYSDYGTEKPRIHIRNLKDGADRELGPGAGDEVGPRWSPDGRWIAYFSQQNGRSGIWKESLDGAVKKRLTPEDMDAILPHWLSASHIVFLGKRGDSNFGLWLVDREGKNCTEMVTEADEDISHFALSGDGRLMIVTRGGNLYQYALKSWSFPLAKAPVAILPGTRPPGTDVSSWLLACGLLLLMSVTVISLRKRMRLARKKEAPSVFAMPSLSTEVDAVTIRNPYIAGNPITDSALFFGREDIFRFIGEKISQSDSSIALVLYGSRRTGKTSVLCQIMNGRLGEGFIPVYNDLQEMADIDTHEFFEHLQKNMTASLSSTMALETQDFSRKSVNPYQMFDSLLDSVERGLELKRPGHCLLMLIDEYEILGGKVEKGHLTDEVFQYLRAIMQNRHRISFIFTGTRQLELLKGSHWALMFNTAIYRKISFLESEEARELIQSPLRGQAVYLPEAVEMILRLTAGHPYFIQLICLNVVDLMNQRHTSRATVDIVQAAVECISIHPVPHLIYIWKECAREERIIMAALAEALTDPEARVSLPEIEKKLVDERITLGEEQIRNALSTCAQQEYIERPGEGAYRFRMDLLRYWIAREHPLWKVAEDGE